MMMKGFGGIPHELFLNTHQIYKPILYSTKQISNNIQNVIHSFIMDKTVNIWVIIIYGVEENE